MKKIKLTALGLALALISALFAGCGKTDTNTRKETNQESAAITASDWFAGYEEFDTETREETNQESTATDSINRRIVEGGEFHDGVVFVKIEETSADDTNTAIYVMDNQGNLLYNWTEVTGESYLYSNLVYRNGVLVWNDKMYDKQGNVIASPEQTGYQALVTGSINGYVLACKFVEGFSGDRLWFGVLNTKGEWVHELSVDNALTHYIYEGPDADDYWWKDFRSSLSSDPMLNTVRKMVTSLATKSATVGIINAITSRVIRADQSLVYFGSRTVGHVYYDLINDAVVTSYPRVGTGQSEFDPNYGMFGGSHTAILKSDENGDIETLLLDYEALVYFDGATLCAKADSYSAASNYLLISDDGEILVDLGHYILASEYYEYGNMFFPMSPVWTGEYFICGVYNDTNSFYGCVFDRTGALVFEPVPVEEDLYLCIGTEGFVVADIRDRTLELIAYDLKGDSNVLATFHDVYQFDAADNFVMSENIIRIYNKYITMNGDVLLP